MSDQDFAEIKAQLDNGPLQLGSGQRIEGAANLDEDQADWLVREVERLRDRVFELRIYEGFGQDHGHQRCIAEIARLRDLLGRLESIEYEGIMGCPVCFRRSTNPHTDDCWLAAELHRNDETAAAPKDSGGS